MYPDNVPVKLRERNQWICWRTECRECGERLSPTTKQCPECGEKATKKPVDPRTGAFASSTDSGTWGQFADATEYHEGNPDTDGTGFVFDCEGLVAGIDLDDCRNRETGEIDDWATDIVERLDSFTEISPSGTGLHIYALGFVPDGGNRSPVGDGEIELYDQGRYFTVTGEHVEGTPENVEQRNSALKEIHTEYISDENGGDDSTQTSTTDVDVTEADGSLSFETSHGDALSELRDRDEKLDRLLTMLNPGGYGGDTSRADLATASKLWFWGFDERQISQILRTYRSREKVRERDDYLKMTIGKAKSGDRYEPPQEDAKKKAARSAFEALDGGDENVEG